MYSFTEFHHTEQGMDSEILTHKHINHELCGTPIELELNRAVIEMTMKEFMAVDEKGLIHGGFIFSLADYTAMLAINHPNVVLAGAEVRFIKPVAVGDKVQAEGCVIAGSGKIQTVKVVVRRNTETVFEGSFFCAIPKHHVLEQKK